MKENQDDPFGIFNLADFKKWIKKQENVPNNSIIGLTVESKINKKRLSSEIEVQDGETKDIIKDFYENGGTVTDVDGNIFLIEVDSGTFLIDKTFVRKY